MSLRERILRDNDKLFMNPKHFAETHIWDGRALVCVPDEETALKRKNNNVVDLSWDNNKTETLIQVPVQSFIDAGLPPPRPNIMILFDGKSMKVLQVNTDIGMYTILLVAEDTKRV